MESSSDMTRVNHEHAIKITIRLVLAAVFLWGGIVKVLHPDSFGRVVWNVLWQRPTDDVAVWFGMLLAAVEITLGLLILVDRNQRRWLRMCLILLVLFSLVLVRLLFMNNAPSCGCLSAPGLKGSAGEYGIGLVRNVGLLWLAWLGILASHNSSPNAEDPPRPSIAVPHKPWRGFTLIELLISISIIAVLVGITLPVLSSARVQAKLTRLSIVQRQLFSALSQYAEDNNATFPYFGTRGDPFGPVTIGETVFSGTSYFMPPVSNWATVLVPGYIPVRSMIEHERMAEVSADRGHPEIIMAQSALVACVFADPKFFTEQARSQPLDYSQFRAMRTFEVVYPSDKAILTPWSAWGALAYPEMNDANGYPCTFADGATGIFPTSEILSWPTVEIPWFGEQPMHTTDHGLAGRDR